MGLFRKKTKIQLVNVKSQAARATYHPNNFATVDLKTLVADTDDARRADVTEVTITMSIWEAAKLIQQLQNAVFAAKTTLPRAPISVPWGEEGIN